MKDKGKGKIIGDIRGVTLNPDKPSQLLFDSSFGGSVIITQDTGLGIMEKMYKITREGDELKITRESSRAYNYNHPNHIVECKHSNYEFQIKCQCGAICEFEQKDMGSDKEYITTCELCGAIFMNPYYKDSRN